MKSITKLWMLRLGSIPMVLLFWVVCLTTLLEFSALIWGKEDELFLVFISFPVSVIIAILFSIRTVFASRTAPLKLGGRILASMLAISILILLRYYLLGLRERPYDRADLKFEVILPATVDVTGKWKGSWTDPRMHFTEEITLTLVQSGYVVSGSILDERGANWLIIDGQVSGSQLNLFYYKEHAFQTRGATLLGELKDDRLTGYYYGHERPLAGWSSKGSWQASRIKPP